MVHDIKPAQYTPDQENLDPETVLLDLTQQPAAQRKPLRERDVEQLQDIIIRAHYLSMELRDICAVSGLNSPQMSLATGQMLKSWALAFAENLERVIDRRISP